ncbi:MAG: hypothetical protein D6714_15485, partial [Bacteroidetes bacterium]
MRFPIGSKVKFLHSGDEGVVTKWLDNGMVSVWLKSVDMDIPAFPDDLISAESPETPAPETNPQAPTADKPKSTAPLPGFGVQLAFEPQPLPDGTPDKYLIHLINGTPYEFVYELSLSFLGEEEEYWCGKILGNRAISPGFLLFDDLNDAPAFALKGWYLTTEGKSPAQEKNLKIRPKHFLKTPLFAPILDKPAFL